MRTPKHRVGASPVFAALAIGSPLLFGRSKRRGALPDYVEGGRPSILEIYSDR